MFSHTNIFDSTNTVMKNLLSSLTTFLHRKIKFLVQSRLLADRDVENLFESSSKTHLPELKITPLADGKNPDSRETACC